MVGTTLEQTAAVELEGITELTAAVRFIVGITEQTAAVSVGRDNIRADCSSEGW